MRELARYRITKPIKQIGLISDTHGLLRPQVAVMLRGVDLIVHAGDIGKAEVLDALGKIAPVYAIKGNNDREQWAKKIPHTMIISIGELKLYVIHAVQELGVDPTLEGFHVVVSGHSHKPSIKSHEGVLYINPGSAGPRRFKLPVGVGKLRLTRGRFCPELISL